MGEVEVLRASGVRGRRLCPVHHVPEGDRVVDPRLFRGRQASARGTSGDRLQRGGSGGPPCPPGAPAGAEEPVRRATDGGGGAAGPLRQAGAGDRKSTRRNSSQ